MLVESFKVCCKDISSIVVLFDLWNLCKRLQNFSHICFWMLKKAVSLQCKITLLSRIVFAFQSYTFVSFTMVLCITMEEVCYTDFVFTFQI